MNILVVSTYNLKCNCLIDLIERNAKYTTMIYLYNT